MGTGGVGAGFDASSAGGFWREAFFLPSVPSGQPRTIPFGAHAASRNVRLVMGRRRVFMNKANYGWRWILGKKTPDSMRRLLMEMYHYANELSA